VAGSAVGKSETTGTGATGTGSTEVEDVVDPTVSGVVLVVGAVVLVVGADVLVVAMVVLVVAMVVLVVVVVAVRLKSWMVASRWML
jgi:hypothetical protein